jgi:membrane protein implicated in regulation of membrane protease activity
MSEYSTLWWVLAGVLIVMELLTGTFYLLMISLGIASAAVASHLGLGLVGQIVIAAIVGSGAVLTWHQHRKAHPQAAPANSNADVNLDVGSTVHISDASVWQSDGSALVHYRGAEWSAQLATGAAAQAGNFVIEQVVGNRLILRNA